MCGFSGYLSKKSPSEDQFGTLKESLHLIKHRGPDHQGIIEHELFAVAHARLAIIDPDERSNQPMESEESILAFNGEIYNYKALRAGLEQNGIEFKTASDTEVLLHGLEYYGEQFISQLNGCFAFAFYSKKDQNLLLSRDPMGINPLWFYPSEEGVYFSSEGKGLIPFHHRPALNQRLLKDYFSFSYVHTPDSLISGTQKLLPGESVTVSFQTSEKKQSNRIIPKLSPKSSLLENLESAVQDRLIADVPLGSFLSGGLDSSIIAAIAAERKPNLHTFSIGFSESYFDETAHAERVANHIGSEHHAFTMTLDDLAEEALSLPAKLDEPFADSSCLSVSFLSKKTREFVTVALSGDGADELFGGYNKHRALHFHHQSPLASLSRWASWLPEGNRNSKLSNASRKLKKLGQLNGKSLAQAYHFLRRFTSEEQMNTWLKDQASIKLDSQIKDLNEVLKADQQYVLPNDMLTKVDLMSMAHHLEVRTPFLDPRVVQCANAMEATEKFNAKEGKLPLRSIAKDLLPKSILTREKMGFEIPLDVLLKGPLKEELDGVIKRLSDHEIALNRKDIEADWHQFLAGKQQQGTIFWMLFVLIKWKEHFRIS